MLFYIFELNMLFLDIGTNCSWYQLLSELHVQLIPQ